MELLNFLSIKPTRQKMMLRPQEAGTMNEQDCQEPINSTRSLERKFTDILK